MLTVASNTEGAYRGKQRTKTRNLGQTPTNSVTNTHQVFVAHWLISFKVTEALSNDGSTRRDATQALEGTRGAPGVISPCLTRADVTLVFLSK